MWYKPSLRPSLFLRSLCAILGTGLSAICNTRRIQRTTDHVIPCTGKVLNSAATNKNNTMLLKVMTFAGDIACYLNTV